MLILKISICKLFCIVLHRFQLWTLSPAVYPVNAQFKKHFREFLTGYRSSAESVEVKFQKTAANRAIGGFTVGIVDGFLKVLLMMGVACIIHELDTLLF